MNEREKVDESLAIGRMQGYAAARAEIIAELEESKIRLDVALSHARWFVGQALETMMNNVDGEPRSSMYVYDLLKKAEAALDIPQAGKI